MKKLGRTYILEQDEHLQNLRKIIKRDFFSTATENEKSDTIQLSLDQYISNFKSNENQIFSELVQSDKQKWKNQHWWFDKQDKIMMLEQQKLKAIKQQDHQYQNMIQKVQMKDNKIAITGQQAKNSFFFNRDKNFGSYLAEQSQNSKKINYKNCRLNIQQKIIENKKDQKGQDSQEDQNPMTWGQVQATPLRIKTESEYRIPQRPNKDILLDKLNQKINKNKLQALNSTKKSELLKKIMGSSTPAYKNSSYVRNSSIKRANALQTPRNQTKNNNSSLELKGLLKIDK